MKKILFISALSLTYLFGYWGENAKGVIAHFDTNKKVVALTFDACGGSVKSSGYDKKLIDFLIEHKIQATLFINSRWIDTNPELFKALASNPLFEIENHGTKHKPLSLAGAKAYNIEGTKNAGEVKEEILGNDQKILALTGRKMRFFRSGTAYYDDESVQILNSLGYDAIGFSINGDAGATFSEKEIENALLKAKPGDIIISHMNHPEGQTANGYIKALTILQKEGWGFVKLEQALPKR